MRIAFITAGAGGMFCGSCLHDNTLAAALIKEGHDAILMPTYTPIRTDEESVSLHRVFMGGINVYLQQRFRFFRHTPWLLDRILDFPPLLRWVSRFAVRTEAADLADLTISILQGQKGNQVKEIYKLQRFFETTFQPDVILFTNVLLSGIALALQQSLKVPVISLLQGDDVFLEALPPKTKESAIQLINDNSLSLTGFISTSHYYANFMSSYLGLDRGKISVVYPGLNLKGHRSDHPIRSDPPFTIGYFARICPEKGFDQFVDAFIELHQAPNCPETHALVSGWLGENQKEFFATQMKKIHEAKLTEKFKHITCPDLDSKIDFFHQIDLLSVPTRYHEPKGLSILEAIANGVPVVQPAHGSFPELIRETGGGILVEPDSKTALVQGWLQLLNRSEFRYELAERGKNSIQTRFHAQAMARETVRCLQEMLHFPSETVTSS